MPLISQASIVRVSEHTVAFAVVVDTNAQVPFDCSRPATLASLAPTTLPGVHSLLT